MKVNMSKRLKRAHDDAARVGRVSAKLTGQAVGDITLGVPVITEDQLRRMTVLAERIEQARDLLEELGLALDCLRGANHPEGWAEIKVVERAGDVVVARIVHHKKKTEQKADRSDRRSIRRFHNGGYSIRGMR